MASRQLRRLFGTTAAAATLVISGVATAGATTPEHEQFSFSGTVADSGEACGDPLSWDFVGDVRSTDFFDSDGNLVRTHLHIYESGTLTNLATGEVIVLPETAFLAQLFWTEGTLSIVQTAGLTVRVTGADNFFMEVGRFVTSRNPNEVLHVSGMQAIRENSPFSTTDPVQLRAFCDLFD
jgi:hypothetical protein